MDFYIVELNDYLENMKINERMVVMNDSFEEYYETGCIYFALFIFSTIIGVIACTMNESRKEYILIEDKGKSARLAVMNKV